jgi:hypothetical protein
VGALGNIPFFLMCSPAADETTSFADGGCCFFTGAFRLSFSLRTEEEGNGTTNLAFAKVPSHHLKTDVFLDGCREDAEWIIL